MKNPLKSFFLVFIISTCSIATVSATDPIESKAVKDKNLFVFKSSKKFLGANVEVVYDNGVVLTSQILAKRKMIIDFSDVKQGAYTIRVTKGKQKEEFHYAKK